MLSFGESMQDIQAVNNFMIFQVLRLVIHNKSPEFSDETADKKILFISEVMAGFEKLPIYFITMMGTTHIYHIIGIVEGLAQLLRGSKSILHRHEVSQVLVVKISDIL